MAIPDSERTEYLVALSEARALAAGGDYAAGRARLSERLERAHAEAAAGKPWGRLLAVRYELGLRWFAHHFGPPPARDEGQASIEAPSPGGFAG